MVFSGLSARRVLPRAGAVIIALSLVLLVWSGIAVSLIDERDAALAAGARSARNLARAYEESVYRSFSTIDRALLSVRDAYARDPAHFNIRDWATSTRALGDLTVQIALADRHGIVTAGTITPIGTKVDISDRDEYRSLRDDPYDRLFIGPPIIGRVSGRKIIVLARKLLTEGGAFDGLVFVSVETAFLSDFYSEADLGAQGAVALTGLDGILRARSGNSEQLDAKLVGRSTAGSQLLREAQRATDGAFIGPSPLDGVTRIVGFRRVRRFPLVVNVAISQAEALAQFYTNARIAFLLGGAVTLLIAAVTGMYLRREARMQQLQDTLRDQYKTKSRELATTLESIGQGILMIGPELEIQVYNRRLLEIFDMPESVVQGRAPATNILAWLWSHGEYPNVTVSFAEWQANFLRAASTGSAVIEHTRPNGTVLEVRRWELPNGGVVRTYTDITARKRDEAVLLAARDEAQQATRAKSAFLAMMSHEIRSPLSGLLGVLELLRTTRLDDEQSRMAAMIQNSGTMLLAVLNDVLDFSKIEANALTIAQAPAALRPLLQETVQPHVVPGRQKGVAVTLTIDPALPQNILTDALRVRQILGNLLANAMKFTAAGSVTVRADLASANGAAELRIVVRDTGIGMDADVLGRLFQPFMQADTSITRQFGGTGLGLTISQKLARMLGGRIGVTSAPGVGSEFTLTLPCIAAAAQAADPVPAAPALRRGLRALLVDDDPTNRWLGQRQLERLGFAVTIAENGCDGLAAARAGAFDLIVTDLHMPGMDGVALTEGVRAAANPVLRALPVIGLTADTTAAQHARCKAAGMNSVEIKPLAGVRLAALVARLLPHAVQAAEYAGTQKEPELQAVAFDSQIFLALFDPGDAEGTQWLRDYLVSARQQAEELRLALADRPAVVTIAHRLAGASFSVGAMTLGAACRALEQAAQAGSPDLPALLAAVEAELVAAEIAIDDFLTAGARSPTQAGAVLRTG